MKQYTFIDEEPSMDDQIAAYEDALAAVALMADGVRSSLEVMEELMDCVTTSTPPLRVTHKKNYAQTAPRSGIPDRRTRRPIERQFTAATGM